MNLRSIAEIQTMLALHPLCHSRDSYGTILPGADQGRVLRQGQRTSQNLFEQYVRLNC